MKRRTDSQHNDNIGKIPKIPNLPTGNAMLPPKPIFTNNSNNVDTSVDRQQGSQPSTNTSVELFPGMMVDMPAPNSAVTDPNAGANTNIQPGPSPEALQLFNTLMGKLQPNQHHQAQPIQQSTYPSNGQGQGPYGQGYQQFNNNSYGVPSYPNNNSLPYNQYPYQNYQQNVYGQTYNNTPNQNQLPQQHDSNIPPNNVNPNNQLLAMLGSFLQQQQQQQQQQQIPNQQQQQIHQQQYQPQPYPQQPTNVPGNYGQQMHSVPPVPQNNGFAYPNFNQNQSNKKKKQNNKSNQKNQNSNVNPPKKQENKVIEPESKGDNSDDDIFEDEEDDWEKSVAIQGTNIVFENEEDIEKWVQERKKNWPTNKRVQEKKDEQEKAKRIMENLNKDGTAIKDTRPIVKVCNFWMKTKRCRNGKNCKFSHDDADIAAYKANLQNQNKSKSLMNKALPNHKIRLIQGIPVQVPQRFTPLNNKGKSLHSLIVEGDQFKEENMQLIKLFEKLVNTGTINQDWDGLKKKLKLDDEFLSSK